MLNLTYTSKFKKDTKRMQKRGAKLTKLKTVIELLQKQSPLASRYRDHSLTGNFSDHRECHIEPDWLLIYKLLPNELRLERTGTHSDLFK